MAETILRVVAFDIGLRKFLTSSDGKVFMIKDCTMADSLDAFLEKNYPEYTFVCESFLQTQGFLEAFGVSKSFVNKTNKLLKYFLTKYKERIEYIESRDSSIQCSNCDYICHYNRATVAGKRCKKIFRCMYCDHIEDSDLNAAKNLMKRWVRLYGEGSIA